MEDWVFSGAWAVLRTKSQDISAILTILFKICMEVQYKIPESTVCPLSYYSMYNYIKDCLEGKLNCDSWFRKATVHTVWKGQDKVKCKHQVCTPRCLTWINKELMVKNVTCLNIK